MQRNRDRPEEVVLPTSEDFRPQAVKKAVQRDAFQHPLTVLPAAGAGVSVLGLLAFGVTPAGLLTTLVLGFVAASSWGYLYLFKGEERAAKYIEQLRERRRRFHLQEAGRIQEACRLTGFSEGAKEAGELAQAFRQLMEFLSRQLKNKDNVNFSAQHFQSLAEDAYRQGLAILKQALDVFHALENVDIETLEGEISKWKRQLSRNRNGDKQALQSQIDAHQKTIKAYLQRKERLSLLLAESNSLEGALNTTLLQATELARADLGAFTPGNAATDLERAVEVARRAEEKLRGLESPSDDEEYLGTSNP